MNDVVTVCDCEEQSDHHAGCSGVIKQFDLGDFNRDTDVDARLAALSISKTADLPGFLHTTVSKV